MDVILQQLGDLMLKAVPTFLLVILVHFYLKGVFFRPLQKVLGRRYEATEGARQRAEASLQRAAAKTAEYDAAMRAARGEVYLAQERLHKQLQERLAAQVAEAQKRAEAGIESAKVELARETESVKKTIARDSERLAAEIADSILRRSAA